MKKMIGLMLCFALVLGTTAAGAAGPAYQLQISDPAGRGIQISIHMDDNRSYEFPAAVNRTWNEETSSDVREMVDKSIVRIDARGVDGVLRSGLPCQGLPVNFSAGTMFVAVNSENFACVVSYFK